jgi:FAD/FMN-containing dehydrogenase
MQHASPALTGSLALPSSNPVGAIPFFLNKGNSPLVSRLGYGSDNIVRARMVTSTGEIVIVSDTENNELLYATGGAGQFFRLVTSLTVRTYPVQEIFSNKEGTFWSGRFVFPLESTEEVASAMESIVNNETYCTAGLVMYVK